jgi:hypothetical protein
MAFENAKQIIKLAGQLDAAADAARDRLDTLVAANDISNTEARRAARKISVLRDDAVDISFGAAHLVINDLQLTQQELMTVIKDAKEKVATIQNVAEFLNVLSALGSFSAAAAAGNPGPILASLDEVRKQVV